MSAENVEVARAAYEAFRRGDLEGVGKYFADDIVWERQYRFARKG